MNWIAISCITGLIVLAMTYHISKKYENDCRKNTVQPKSEADNNTENSYLAIIAKCINVSIVIVDRVLMIKNFYNLRKGSVNNKVHLLDILDDSETTKVLSAIDTLNSSNKNKVKINDDKVISAVGENYIIIVNK